MIYVYCADEDCELIKNILEIHNIKVKFNDYGLKDFSNKAICHYKYHKLNGTQQDFLIRATEYGAKVEPLISFLDRALGFTEVKLLHNGYFLHQKAFSILSARKAQKIKRAMDVLLSLVLLLLFLPFIILTIVLIKLDSKGPILYRQLRTGQFNKEFEVLKFRSMKVDAEKDGAKWASENDSRVTRVGKIIRKIRVDELPQLINVLKGEMSIIGPRPEREVFIKELEKQVPYYRFRHAVKPGITGLAQVSYAYGASVEDAIWKHKYDIYYIKHHTLWLDLVILLKTIRVVLFGLGR